jgi:4-amino-4-deoxy-L-arabinose transferase-like glycosyltransferase
MMKAGNGGSLLQMNRSGADLLPPRPAPTTLPEAARAGRLSYGAMAVAAIAVLTAIRLLWLIVQPADLYPDEAQYWFWAQHLALGYYSKPPLIAWVIALTTGLFGDGTFGIRVAAPLFHAASAALAYLVAARLYDRRIGFWAALAYASLPGTSLSSFIISTDAILLPCWGAALYCLIRAREPGGGIWWAAAGIAVGLGFLAKYAMAYWLIGAFGYLALTQGEHRHLKGLAGALALAALLYVPNLWWNWSHGFVSYLHVRDNAGIVGAPFHPMAAAEFVASQFAVFGPIFMALLIAIAASPAAWRDWPGRLLAGFAFPVLAVVLIVSFLSRAQPNWGAPAYLSATVLVVAWGLRRNRCRTLAVAIGLNLALAAAAFGAALVGLPAKADPLHRLRGWHRLGEAVAAELRAHPGLTLLADDREVLASLIYYVRPHPFDAVLWSPLPQIRDQWTLTNNLARHRGEDFLAVTDLGLGETMKAEFAAFTPLGEITISPGPGGSRTYRLYIGRDYRGPPGG